MNTHTPDRWVVVEISNKNEKFRRVFAGWYGGYATGDSWKLSSAVETVEEFDDKFEFKNASGSLYICYKNYQKMSNYLAGIYQSWQDAQTDDLKIEIIKY